MWEYKGCMGMVVYTVIKGGVGGVKCGQGCKSSEGISMGVLPALTRPAGMLCMG